MTDLLLILLASVLLVHVFTNPPKRHVGTTFCVHSLLVALALYCIRCAR